MSYDIQLQHFPACPLAVVRRRATLQELGRIIPEACGTVWNVLRQQQVKGAGRHVAVYLDDVFHLEVGVVMDKPFSGHGEVIASSLPAGEVAMTTHLGPYPALIHAHRAIQQWCAAHGREREAACWETYGHWRDEWNNDPSQIRTDVYYLLKPGRSRTRPHDD